MKTVSYLHIGNILIRWNITILKFELLNVIGFIFRCTEVLITECLSDESISFEIAPRSQLIE
jgi:hypothetical protein